MRYKILFTCLLIAAYSLGIKAQKTYELNNNWLCKNIKEVKESGEALSKTPGKLSNWQPATVPGTVLTTMLNNKQVPDPFFGMNNKKIPDIYYTGRDYYTYWFVNDFKEKTAAPDEQVWLDFRGINYSCDVFLNGYKLNAKTHVGMFLRQSYNITTFLTKDGNNRLAVIVYPPDPVGNPNGGQGGDGVIAKNVSHQYVAGWDWIQPIADRNTGIWDKVTISKTSKINLINPHIITLVSGKRIPGKDQQAATIKASAEIVNPSDAAISGTLRYKINGQTVSQTVNLQPKSTTEITLPDFTLENPKLWWPNGYGEQYLYPVTFDFIDNQNHVCDSETLKVGVRELQFRYNEHTRSMQVHVNGQKVFIKGGNWIVSDEMLRFSDARYDAEIRFHRDMNLNLIRIWGGALTERPEFYDACDKYGLLVFQDFWNSGDCNGRWLDPMKKDDQWTRRKYPDDHQLYLNSVVDQVKMIRNHASLALYCGGNEIVPPIDIYYAMKDSIMPKLDGTRYFFAYSNSDSMSYNSLGGNGDGPYTIQPISLFWENRTFPFNSEVGNVGTGDIESLERFIPKENLVLPDYATGKVDSVWKYHKDIGYGKYIDAYGKPTDVRDFGVKAQLVNYDQYRALSEGFSAHEWDWYTGFIIWKTQNPWTALRGQMYDYYLDPNACLYGLNHGSEPLHSMCNPVDGMIMTVNNTFRFYHDIMLQVKYIDLAGKETLISQVFCDISPTSVQKYFPIKDNIDKLKNLGGGFICVRLLNISKEILSDNLYWFSDAEGQYSGLQSMKKTSLKADVKKSADGKIALVLTNPSGNPVAFFSRISIIDNQTKKRVLPVFYSDNYVSVLPGEQKTIQIENASGKNKDTSISLSGWNVEEQIIKIE